MRVIHVAGMPRDELDRILEESLEEGDEVFRFVLPPGIPEDDWLGPGPVPDVPGTPMPSPAPAPPPAPRDCFAGATLPPSRPWSRITVCYLCLQPLSGEVHMDHVLPKSMGGENGPVMPVHPRCNLIKSNRPLIAPVPAPC